MNAPWGVLRLAGSKFFLADGTQRPHKDDHRLAIQCATSGVYLLNVLGPWSLCPADLHAAGKQTMDWGGASRPEVHKADCMWQTMTAARPLGKVPVEDQVFPAYSRRGLGASQQMTPGACLFAQWLQAHDMPAASLGSRQQYWTGKGLCTGRLRPCRCRQGSNCSVLRTRPAPGSSLDPAVRSSDSVLARLGRLADFALAPAAIAGSGSVGIAEGCMVLASCKVATGVHAMC